MSYLLVSVAADNDYTTSYLARNHKHFVLINFRTLISKIKEPTRKLNLEKNVHVHLYAIENYELKYLCCHDCCHH